MYHRVLSGVMMAVVQSGTGNQFDLTAYSTLADVKSAIDKWAEMTARNLRAIKADGVAR